MTLNDQMRKLTQALVSQGILFHDAVAEFEKQLIQAALERTNGNLSSAATLIRVHRNTASKKLEGSFENDHMRAARLRRKKG